MIWQGGPGLAFIVYPEIVTRIGTGLTANIFAALFFLMLVTLALGSIFGAFETVISAICDQVLRWLIENTHHIKSTNYI